MGIYAKNNYLDFDWIVNRSGPFCFIVGARGVGKTYGALKYVLENNIKFLFMRRRQNEIEMLSSPDTNPLKANTNDITIKSINKNMFGFYNTDEDGRPEGSPRGYMCALSTISKLRGFDMHDVKIIIFDEFIGEAHDTPIKQEGKAFKNAYETVNRNRELEGFPPVKVLALANSNELANPIFMEMRIVTAAEKMSMTGNQYYNDERRGITIIMPSGSKISEAKRGTALYRASEGSDFADMAIENKFSGYTSDNVSPQPLGEYKPLAFLGELGIYRHKSARRFYICSHRAGAAKEYRTGADDLKRARHDLYYLRLAFLNNRIFFDSYLNKVIFEKYLDI